MRDIILLNNDSSKTVFCNEEYVSEIQISDIVLELETNRGELISNKICEVLYLRKHYFNKNELPIS